MHRSLAIAHEIGVKEHGAGGTMWTLVKEGAESCALMSSDLVFSGVLVKQWRSSWTLMLQLTCLTGDCGLHCHVVRPLQNDRPHIREAGSGERRQRHPVHQG